jgi:hypothetical protein
VRGSDERSGSLFSYVDLEARVRGDHPLRTIRELANAALGAAVESIRGTLYRFWTSLDCTREVASGDVAAGVLRHSL